MKSKVNVHVPYSTMLDRQGEILNASINPEIFFDGRALEGASSKELIAIRDGFAGRGQRITMHGPFMDLSPGAADESIRCATVERFRQTLQAAAYLKPAVVVLHAGYDDRRFDHDVELWFSQSIKTWKPLISRAEGMGVVIALENVFEENPFAMSKLMDAFPSKHFGVCLDAGHLNIFSGVPMNNWFETIGARIAEVHLHDNHGKTDEHLVVGEGAIDFNLFFALLKKRSKNPVYTIEPHGEAALQKGLLAVERFL
ncbi:MAG: sugar phosphate isomerase/epimerase family protein [Thermodesulfobacteriota bacterium]